MERMARGTQVMVATDQGEERGVILAAAQNDPTTYVVKFADGTNSTWAAARVRKAGTFVSLFISEPWAIYEAAHVPEGRWNGWACPGFTLDVVRQIAKDSVADRERFGIESDLIEVDDEGRVWVDRWTGESDNTTERVQIEPSATNGLFYVGGWEWCWSEAEDLDPDASPRRDQGPDTGRAGFLKAVKAFGRAGQALADAWDAEDGFNADQAAPLPEHLLPPLSFDEWIVGFCAHYAEALEVRTYHTTREREQRVVYVPEANIYAAFLRYPEHGGWYSLVVGGAAADVILYAPELAGGGFDPNDAALVDVDDGVEDVLGVARVCADLRRATCDAKHETRIATDENQWCDACDTGECPHGDGPTFHYAGTGTYRHIDPDTAARGCFLIGPEGPTGAITSLQGEKPTVTVYPGTVADAQFGGDDA